MSDSGKKILLGFKRRWQLLQLLEIFLYGLGPAILGYALTLNSWFAISIGIVVASLVFVFRRPWRLSLEQVGKYVDRQLDAMQHSTGLLLLPKEKLSDLAWLQRHEVSQTLSGNIKNVRPQVPIRLAVGVFTVFVVLALWGYNSGWAEGFQNAGELPDIQKVTFHPLDSTAVKYEPPVLISQKLTIRPPSYTKLGPIHQSKMQVRALKGSRVFWNIQFDTPVDTVIWESSENSRPMNNSENGYFHSTILQTSGFYNFRFTDTDGASYQSELYALEVLEDEPPVVEIRNLDQFVSFTSVETKILNIKASISDDYGLQEAYIVSTVSSGEGESVKFREERMAFNEGLDKGSKSQDLTKQIDLDQLDMAPGDELYFYIGVTDTKNPRPNTSRSETYFAVIEDTVSDQFAMESTMGADLMPAYFRSQRQLIIDTEKLIADRNNMPQEKFKLTSNTLGGEQKALRLKYGQFMGDEDDSSIQGGAIPLDGTSDDPTAAYTHDHDADNEEAHGHEEVEDGEKQESPLENYLHNHDNPEESTLFTQSLKSMLRQAMQQMWDAELQLRLHAPEKSLPYQYKALKLIQEIKNSSRVYVHRIGFDAPPIKEANRLTGDITAVSSVHKQENLEESLVFPAIRKAVERLETLIQQDKSIGKADRTLFEAAGKELASLAVEQPGKYLITLQELRWLADRAGSDKAQLEMVRNGLLKAIPPSKPDVARQQVFVGEINELLLQELNPDD